jgi:hypothetical protein
MYFVPLITTTARKIARRENQNTTHVVDTQKYAERTPRILLAGITILYEHGTAMSN